MTADEVLEEFLLDPCCIDCPASDCINERRMADEIVRLRSILAALRNPSDLMVDALREQIYNLSCFDEALKAIRVAVAAAEEEVR